MNHKGVHIDKLFLMMPNYTITYRTKDGSKWNEKGALIAELKKKGIDVTVKQAAKLIQDSNYVEELEYDKIDLKGTVDSIMI